MYADASVHRLVSDLSLDFAFASERLMSACGCAHSTSPISGGPAITALSRSMSNGVSPQHMRDMREASRVPLAGAPDLLCPFPRNTYRPIAASRGRRARSGGSMGRWSSASVSPNLSFSSRWSESLPPTNSRWRLYVCKFRMATLSAMHTELDRGR